MTHSRDFSSVCAEIQRHLRLQTAHSVVLAPVLALPSCAAPHISSDAAKYCEQLAVTLASYLNNWASLADASAMSAFARAMKLLPAHQSPALLLKALKLSVTVDGSTALLQHIFEAFKPSALDSVFAALTAGAQESHETGEELFRLICIAPSAAAAILKQQTPSWLDADVFVPAFITAALTKMAAANALLLELVLSQSCVQGYTRHALAALQAVIEAGTDVARTMKGAVAAMKLPVLLRVIDHTVHCHYHRDAYRAVLGAVLCLQPSHAAISYLSTDLWRQCSLTHHAACALVDLLLATCGDFSVEPLQTVVHCLSDIFARESFANSGHEAHHFAVCAALRRMLMAPNSKIMASNIVPLLFTGISNHLKCLVHSPRRHGMWVAEAVAPVLAVQGSDGLDLLQAEERAQLQKELDSVCVNDGVAVYFHMVRDDAPAPHVSSTCIATSSVRAPDDSRSAANGDASSHSGTIGVSIADDGWSSDENGAGATGDSGSDEDDVLSYALAPEAEDKMWRSLEEGAQLLLHEDANKVDQALRVAARSIRCSRQMVPEYSDRLWKALQHARAKFDEEQLSVCALSAMSQVLCVSRS